MLPNFLALLLVLLVVAPLPAQGPADSWTRLQEALRVQGLELDTTDERCRRVETLGKSLTALQRRYPLDWRFVVVKSVRTDAGCTGIGVVYVTQGLLDLGLEDDELAGILGHEIAHGLLSHIETNQLLAERSRQAREEYTRVLQRVEKLEQMRSTIDEREFERQKNELLQQALALKDRIQLLQAEARFAKGELRRQEIQADSMGLQLARRAGYQPDGLIRALLKLDEANSADQNLRTYRHPPIQQRVRELERLLKDLDRLLPLEK